MFQHMLRRLRTENGLSMDDLVAEYNKRYDAKMNKSTLSRYENGLQKPMYTTVMNLANVFGVTVDYLLGKTDNPAIESPVTQCNDCGMIYNSQDQEQVTEHDIRHQLWKKAVQKFGFCWPYSVREKSKTDARNRIAEESLSTDQFIEAQMIVFSALFSRSLEQSQFDLNHVPFPEYIAMLLNQSFWKRELPSEIYDEFVKRYGIKPGIPTGTLYSVPQKEKSAPKGELIEFDSFDYAMQNETKELAPEDKQILLDMAKRLNAARKNMTGNS